MLLQENSSNRNVMWQDCGRAIGERLGECSGMRLMGIAGTVFYIPASLVCDRLQ